MKKLLILTLALCAVLPAFGQEWKGYGIKSGYLKTVTTTGEQKSYNYLWFDDYGNKEKGVTEWDMPGIGHFTATTLMVGMETWVINDEGEFKKSEGRPEVNYLTLTEEQMKEFNIKLIGEEEYAGKKCTVYSEEVTQKVAFIKTKSTVTRWVWKGITLKQVIKQKHSESVIELDVFKENPNIPASTFAIPE